MHTDQSQARLEGAIIQNILDAISGALGDPALQHTLGMKIQHLVSIQAQALLHVRLGASPTDGPSWGTAVVERATLEVEASIADVHDLLIERVRSRLHDLIREEVYGVYYDLLEDVAEAPVGLRPNPMTFTTPPPRSPLTTAPLSSTTAAWSGTSAFLGSFQGLRMSRRLHATPRPLHSVGEEAPEAPTPFRTAARD